MEFLTIFGKLLLKKPSEIFSFSTIVSISVGNVPRVPTPGGAYGINTYENTRLSKALYLHNSSQKNPQINILAQSFINVYLFQDQMNAHIDSLGVAIMAS